MAETLDSEEIQLTTCHICLQTFREPKLLPCLDTFCRQCLEELRSRQSQVAQSVLCPTCGTTTTLPTDGVGGLQDNSFVVALIGIKKLQDEQKRRKMVCSACSRDTTETLELPVAVVFCVNCDDKLCQVCSDAHRKLKVTIDHRLVPVDADFLSKLSEARRSKPVFCQLHRDLACAIYCQNSECLKPICLQCAVLTHKTHDYADIAEVAGQLRRGLMEVADGLIGKLGRLTQQFQALEKRKTIVEENTKKVESLLHQRSEAVLDLVETGRKELVASAQNFHEQHVFTLKESEDFFDTEFSDLYNALSFGLALTQKGSDAQICNLIKQFERKADSVKEKKTDDLPPNEQSPLLAYKAKHTSDSLDRASLVLGSVETTESDAEGEQMPVDETNKIQEAAAAAVTADLKQSTVAETVRTKDVGSVQNPSSSFSGKRQPNLTGKITGKNPVRGIAVIDDTLFVIHRSASTVNLYNVHSLLSAGIINVKGLENPTDMAACHSTKRIYICDTSNKVFRIGELFNRNTVDVHTLDKKPFCVSVTPKCHVLVSHPQNRCFSEFTADWRIVRVVETPGLIPFHVVCLKDDCFVTCGGWFSNSVSICCVDESQKPGPGKAIAVRVHEMITFNRPTHIAVDANHLIFIVDSHKHRIVCADSKLSKQLWTHEDNYTNGLYRCCLNSCGNRLYVGVENCLRDVIVLKYGAGSK